MFNTVKLVILCLNRNRPKAYCTLKNYSCLNFSKRVSGSRKTFTRISNGNEVEQSFSALTEVNAGQRFTSDKCTRVLNPVFGRVPRISRVPMALRTSAQKRYSNGNRV